MVFFDPVHRDKPSNIYLLSIEFYSIWLICDWTFPDSLYGWANDKNGIIAVPMGDDAKYVYNIHI